MASEAFAKISPAITHGALEVLSDFRAHSQPLFLTDAHIKVEVHPGFEGALAGFRKPPSLRFEGLSGSVYTDPGTAGHLGGWVRIPSKSLHVVSEDITPLETEKILRLVNTQLLETEKFGEIHFKISSVRSTGDTDSFIIDGLLTFRGVTHEYTLKFDAFEDRKYRGTFELSQLEFGIIPLTAMMGTLRCKDEVEIQIELRLPDPIRSEEKSPGFLTTTYGPVKSRRFGTSLGVNLGNPERKFCNWGCLYCEAGFGTRIRIVPGAPGRVEILKELETALDQHPKIDAVTLSGNSEPTLHPDFLKVIEDILELRKERSANWKLICFSNGSQLAQDQIRIACDLTDETWIKLDCGDETLFKKLNCPLDTSITLKDHLENIRKLKVPRVQTMLWHDRSGRSLHNCSPKNLEDLMAVYLNLRPFAIHLTTIDRAPAFSSLEPVPTELLENFAVEMRLQGLSVRVFPKS